MAFKRYFVSIPGFNIVNANTNLIAHEDNSRPLKLNKSYYNPELRLKDGSQPTLTVYGSYSELCDGLYNKVFQERFDTLIYDRYRDRINNLNNTPHKPNQSVYLGNQKIDIKAEKVEDDFPEWVAVVELSEDSIHKDEDGSQYIQPFIDNLDVTVINCYNPYEKSVTSHSFPKSYSNLIAGFNDLENYEKAINIANLFQDYADKSGVRGIFYFHWGRSWGKDAEKLASKLKADPEASNETMMATIADHYLYMTQKEGKEIRADGSFQRRVDFAILQLSHGLYSTMREFLDANPIVEETNQLLNSLPDIESDDESYNSDSSSNSFKR